MKYIEPKESTLEVAKIKIKIRIKHVIEKENLDEVKYQKLILKILN